MSLFPGRRVEISCLQGTRKRLVALSCGQQRGCFRDMVHVRRRTDSIHGTIYLSEFESALTSTPFFYRLHDIYQSSTVYLTFTSNHTKRYEHSLGVMALASEMLFSSITNAAPEVRTAFFSQLNSKFQSLYLEFIRGKFAGRFPYLSENQTAIKKMLELSNLEPDAGELLKDALDMQIDKCVEQVFESGILSDDALNHFSLYSLHNTERIMGDVECGLSLVRERFLYQCLLQAVRISALFHDVGHPPYSHIIEDALTELYWQSQVQSEEPFRSLTQVEKLGPFQECLGRFVDKTSRATQPSTWFFGTGEGLSTHLHEAAGIYLLEKSVENVMQDIVRDIIQASGQESEEQCAEGVIKALYYITSIEFASAILLEADDLFASIHRIIDGTIDADRLDYVPRDAHSSGVDWGAIPYKRLIDPAKLFQITKDGEKDLEETSSLFVIAYPERVISDIEDFLLNRYRVFTRINYHHRCVRTSKALASCVKALVKDYLESPISKSKVKPITEKGLENLDSDLQKKATENRKLDEKLPVCISPSIHILWTALDNTNGDEALKVLQWNDSWMISVLQSALLRIRTEKHFKDRYVLQAVRRAWFVQRDTPGWEGKSLKEKKQYLKTVEVAKRAQLDELQKNLEEFLLNKKFYYSLFKRGINVQNFVADILKYAGLDEEVIRRRLIEEQQIYYSALEKNPESSPMKDCLTDDNEKGDALDSIERYERLLKAFELGDLKSLATIFPTTDDSVENIMRGVFDKALEKGRIAGYKLDVNVGWDKTGLPDAESDILKGIYLYRDDIVATYDINRILKPQISALQHGMPWIYIYVRPSDGEKDPNGLFDSLRDECAQEVGRKVGERYNELFPGHRVTLSYAK